MIEWPDSIKNRAKARVKVLKLIQRLKEVGNKLRRPESDYLRDGVYELWIDMKELTIVCYTSFQARILRFFLVDLSKRMLFQSLISKGQSIVKDNS